eukprot:Pompholyxophrys_punicea_v1_NODE_2_length_10808_cov_35.677950.p6 type:complete len:136 gc:universal NODE_2_length_10808_cov_35.677950:4397-4804(+)
MYRWRFAALATACIRSTANNRTRSHSPPAAARRPPFFPPPTTEPARFSQPGADRRRPGHRSRSFRRRPRKPLAFTPGRQETACICSAADSRAEKRKARKIGKRRKKRQNRTKLKTNFDQQSTENSLPFRQRRGSS